MSVATLRAPAKPFPRGMATVLGAIFLALTLAIVSLTSALAAPTYPALTGRVVDQAGVLDLATQGVLETKLKDLEDKSGIQLVVATVKSLEGGDVETYANGLFRAWKLGEAKKNNGVLLLVAPNDRRVRIEVGYGLEGTLTDALSKVIIANAMAPRFKEGKFADGVTRGVDDIITVLTTDAAEWQKRPQVRVDTGDGVDGVMIFFLALFLSLFIWSMSARSRAANGRIVRRGNQTIFIPSGGGWSGGGWSGGGGGDWGGGFSGGGGSSGGGGASGSW